MKKQVLFIQGGGEGGYEADEKMVRSLQSALGGNYKINYPQMLTDEAAPDFGWLKQIGDAIDQFREGFIVVAHSLGASLLLKYLSENKVSKSIPAIFLIDTPFWHGNEEWQRGLKLREDFVQYLPGNSRFYFYHSRDDEEVPFDQLTTYKQRLPMATFREIESGGHQLGDNLSLVAKDIKDV